MGSLSFVSTHAVRFDLAEGAVCAGVQGERVVVVPSLAVDELLRAAPPAAAEAFATALGVSIGRRAAARLGSGDAAPAEEFVTQLAGEAAVAGIGALAVERWGRAMVAVIERSPLPAALLPSLIAAALEAAAGRRVWCTLLVRDDERAKILVAGEQTIARAREWLASGMSWGDVLTKLQGASA